jgi:hypothetical protein
MVAAQFFKDNVGALTLTILAEPRLLLPAIPKLTPQKWPAKQVETARAVGTKAW